MCADPLDDPASPAGQFPDDDDCDFDITALIAGQARRTAANFAATLEWYARGYNVVPQKSVNKKHPGVLWEHLQQRMVTPAELQGWRPMFGQGVGFITGEISGVIVVESDGLAGLTVLDLFEMQHGPIPPTLTIRSGSQRGFHFHFRHPGYRVTTAANPAIKLDVKGDGGFCVLPPSIHKSGRCYEIMRDMEPAELPPGLLEFIADAAAKAKAKEPVAAKANAQNYKPKIQRQNNYSRTPVNPRNVEIVLSALAALPDFFADDHDAWVRVGLSLHAFAPGKIGLALFEKFSESSPEKAAETDFEKVWASFGRPYAGKPRTLGSLIHEAQQHGWRQPCAWDRSTMLIDDAVDEDDE